jgi:hypothetical protein
MDFQTLAIIKILLRRHLYSDPIIMSQLLDIIKSKDGVQDVNYNTDAFCININVNNAEEFSNNFIYILINFIASYKDSLASTFEQVFNSPNSILLNLLEDYNSIMLYNITVINDRTAIIYL